MTDPLLSPAIKDDDRGLGPSSERGLGRGNASEPQAKHEEDEESRGIAQRWNDFQRDLKKEMNTAENALDRLEAKKLIRERPTMASLSDKAKEGFFDIYADLGIQGSFSVQETQTIIKALPKLYAIADSRAPQVLNLALHFFLGFYSTASSTVAWFASSQHEAEKMAFLEKLISINWIVSGRDFERGVRVGIVNSGLDTVFFFVDLDVLINNMFVHVSNLCFEPEAEKMAFNFGKALGGMPKAEIRKLYATPTQDIPFEMGRLGGAPLVTFTTSMAINKAVGPISAATIMGGVVNKSLGSADVMMDLVRAGLKAKGLSRVANNKNLSRFEKIVASGFAFMLRKRRVIRFQGRDMVFTNLPGEPNLVGRKSLVRLGFGEAPRPGTRLGWSNEVWGTGGIKYINARKIGSEVEVNVRGEIIRKPPAADNPKFNTKMRLAPKDLSEGAGLHNLHRLHLWGAGWGDEAKAGIMFSHRRVNLIQQNLQAEAMIRDLRDVANKKGYHVLVSATARSHPLEKTKEILARRAGKEFPNALFLKEVSYRFTVCDMDGNAKMPNLELTIKVPHPEPGKRLGKIGFESHVHGSYEGKMPDDVANSFREMVRNLEVEVALQNQ